MTIKKINSINRIQMIWVRDIWALLFGRHHLSADHLGAGTIGRHHLGAMLYDWHVTEINLHIVRVKIVIISKLANLILMAL